jgi:hypothetical protein
MHMAVKALRGAGAAVLLLGWLSSAATAVPVDEHELGRWVPSVGFVLGLSANRAEGHLNTGDVLGPQFIPPPPRPPPDPKILPNTPASARTLMMTPMFGGTFELMTPGLRAIPGSPRAFARADVTFAFGPEYNIPSLGNPGPFSVSPTILDGGAITEGTILGQGGETTASVEPLVVTAGAGIAFTVDAWGRALRLKPSVEYMRQEIKVSGIVHRAVSYPTGSSTTLDGFRDITLAAEDTQVYDFLGAGFELDLDAARAGPVVLAPYLGLKAWAILDNSKVVLVDRNEWGETAVFTFLPNKWAFGGTIGLRFRWVPE